MIYFRSSRLTPIALALAFTAVASAQITSGTSQICYNNSQDAWNSDGDPLGFEQQFVIDDNPPISTLTSPLADYTFVNPLNFASGEVKGNSSITSLFNLSSASASVSGHAFAQAEVITNDATDTFFSSAGGEANMTLHLNSAGTVTFRADSVDIANHGYVQYGIDNTYIGDFLTDGSHTDTQFLGAGDHYVFLFFGADVHGIAGSDAVSSAQGNFNVTVAAVPEPATLGACAMALVAMARRRKRGI